MALDVSSSSLVDGSSNSSSQGAGSVQRQKKLATSIAAIVTRILPNGNMVIEGKQEVRVNFEVREFIVARVIRPEDVEANNTIRTKSPKRGFLTEDADRSRTFSNRAMVNRRLISCCLSKGRIDK